MDHEKVIGHKSESPLRRTRACLQARLIIMASLFAKVVELLRADAELSAADIDHVNTAYEQYTVRVRPVATKMCTIYALRSL